MTTRAVVLNKDTSHRKLRVLSQPVVKRDDGAVSYGEERALADIEPGGSYTHHVHSSSRLIVEEIEEAVTLVEPIPAGAR